MLNYFKKMTCITHTCAWSQKEHWQVKGFIEDTLSKWIKKYKEVNVYMLYRRICESELHVATNQLFLLVCHKFMS